MKYKLSTMIVLVLTISLNANMLDKKVKACDKGKGMECMMLASMFLQGKTVEKDSVLAARFLLKACESGTAVGCYNLGNMYARGEGVSKDHKEAKSLFKKACNKGIDDACYNYKILNKRTLDQNSSK